MKKNCSIILALLFVALSTACTSTKVRNGELEFSRVSFGTKQTIGKIHVNPKTGDVDIEGYSNEQTELAAKALTPVVK
jgi:hypothetical protein